MSIMVEAATRATSIWRSRSSIIFNLCFTPCLCHMVILKFFFAMFKTWYFWYGPWCLNLWKTYLMVLRNTAFWCSEQLSSSNNHFVYFCWLFFYVSQCLLVTNLQCLWVLINGQNWSTSILLFCYWSPESLFSQFLCHFILQLRLCFALFYFDLQLHSLLPTFDCVQLFFSAFALCVFWTYQYTF